MSKFKNFMLGILCVLTGCSGVSVEDYKGQTPKLDLREYLNGDLEAWGILYDYKGKVDMHFHVAMKATWDGNEGKLEEFFTFDDGSTDERVWMISYTDDHNFTATAGDVVGKAKGKQYGNAVNVNYVLEVKRDSGKTVHVNMDDWMYLVDENTLMNHTSMRKFGIQVGELVITFRKK